MALDLTGIHNVGEFYSHHYLDAVLDGDLGALFKRWRAREEDQPGFRAPWKKLGALAEPFFQAKGRADLERDPAERLRLARPFHDALLRALGFEPAPGFEILDKGWALPVVLAERRDGRPYLWVVEAPFPSQQDGDALDQPPLPEQLPEAARQEGLSLPDTSWRELLDDDILRAEHPPWWVLVLGGGDLWLVQRSKWPQGRSLHFELSEIFGRRQTQALKAMAGLLHKEVLSPDGAPSLHDTLDENSHKHAFAVSGDLKHGLRRAVELLANEAIWYLREVRKQKIYGDAALARKLTDDSLTWLYRLLFLFYVEARSDELQAVPMKSETYRLGYSLESLRDLEQVELTTAQAREGFFIHESLRRLFRLVNEGFAQGDLQQQFGTWDHGMSITALNSPLFDDGRLAILGKVRFRNCVLQEVIALLSLSRLGAHKTRGRISYAQLGINQLGAVYEGLLSYSGFFAQEDLLEVAPSGKQRSEDDRSWFVPKSRIGAYQDDEIVRQAGGQPRLHPRGSFVFRLAGRDREKSASYYTPEVLTRCLVKYSLKELLPGLAADQILHLAICEPAMGSGAFLNEAANQLADAYLERKQEELGQTIPADAYQSERQRVKARLATNNCHGVDLNPTAVELAKVSLWLNTIYQGDKCPWFGLRLAAGNSLVGARREVFTKNQILQRDTKAQRNFLGLVPSPVSLYAPDADPQAPYRLPERPQDSVYHFLLPAEGMAAFEKNTVVKQLAPEAAERLKAWRKTFVQKPFSRSDLARLIKLSDAADRLWAQVVQERTLAARQSSDQIVVWPDHQQPPSFLQVRDQEELAHELESNSSAFKRLKLSLDAWCALWFWPLAQAHLLPQREEWLAAQELILMGAVTEAAVYT